MIFKQYYVAKNPTYIHYQLKMCLNIHYHQKKVIPRDSSYTSTQNQYKSTATDKEVFFILFWSVSCE